MNILSPLCRALAIVVVLSALGCGSDGPAARQDILDTPAEELHGASVKGMLYEFRAKVRKHGVTAARDGIPLLLENFAGYEDAAVGDHLETYRQIDEKLKALQTSLAGSATDEQVKQAAEEIGTLADKLPGKAAENPEVE